MTMFGGPKKVRFQWEPLQESKANPGAQATVLLYIPDAVFGFEVKVRVYLANSPVDGAVWYGDAHLNGKDLFTVIGRTEKLAKKKVVARYRLLLKKALTQLGKL
jgi:hypothetical protein